MYPILFSFAGLNVYAYGVMVSLGMVTALILIRRHALLRGIQADVLTDIVFWILVWGLLGGRLFYVFLHFGYYLAEPWEVFKIYKGGLSFHGGLFLGMAAAAFLIKKNKLPFFKTIDIFAVYLPLAHAFGRIGCFLNGCCFGRDSGNWPGIVFPGHAMPVIPTQLYSAVVLLVIFFILLRMEKEKNFDGKVVALYLMLYGTARFVIEFLRADNPQVFGLLTVFHLLSIAVFAAGAALYLWLKPKFRKDR